MLINLSQEKFLETDLLGGPYYELPKKSYIYVIYDPENPREVYWNDVDTYLNWGRIMGSLALVLIFGGVIVFAYKEYKKGNIV